MARVAMVNGAARGIGADASVRLAEHGLDIALIGTDEEAHADTVLRIAGAGRRCLFVESDVTDAGSVEAALSRVCAELGAPGVLLNCVGAVGRGPLHELSDEGWAETVGDPLRGVFLTSRAVIEPMIKNGGGRILALADVAGGEPSGPGRDSVVETGLAGFVRTIALELRPFGITANVVAPELSVADLSGSPAGGGSAYAAEVVDTVRFLADEASAAVTGQIIRVAMTA
ncbi:SDR family oxidoreductase [Streptomyces sp. NPDC046465]|uniref:SDR family NAD(P)-dependent oxidoreductase n=1 Tax=Streptomyces sp. NPDC046465 TaxID=3155810 RepID=UPI0033E899CC